MVALLPRHLVAPLVEPMLASLAVAKAPMPADAEVMGLLEAMVKKVAKEGLEVSENMVALVDMEVLENMVVLVVEIRHDLLNGLLPQLTMGDANG